MVRGVPRRIRHMKGVVEQPLSPFQRLDVALGHRDQGGVPPPPVHVLAIQPAGAFEETRGVEQVRGTPLVYVYLEVGPALHQRTARSSVIQMDVGEQQRPRPLRAKRVQQRLDAGDRPRIDQYLPHLPAADHSLPAEVLNVDQPHRAGLQRLGYSGPPSSGISGGMIAVSWRSIESLSFSPSGGGAGASPSSSRASAAPSPVGASTSPSPSGASTSPSSPSNCMAAERSVVSAVWSESRSSAAGNRSAAAPAIASSCRARSWASSTIRWRSAQIRSVSASSSLSRRCESAVICAASWRATSSRSSASLRDCAVICEAAS